MYKYILLFKMARWGRIIWTVVFPALIFALLFAEFATSETLAWSDEIVSNQSEFSPVLQSTSTPTPTLQVESTPSLQEPATPQIELTPASQDATVAFTPTLQVESTSTFDFSFATLGYEEAALTSPLDGTSYSFRIPEDWLIQSDGVLELDLSYVYSQVRAEDIPTSFGNLTVALNGQTIEILPIETDKLDHQRLRIPLPASLLRSNDNVNVELLLEAKLLCEVPHLATLTIHPTSSISLNYNQGSIIPDISRYPRPFRQRAFEPDSVRFVLPSQSTSNDLTSAVGVAAKLGNLTNNRLAISATTDLDLTSLLPPVSETFDEHLIVIGQPQDNQMLPLLNNATDLPVSLHRQQLELVMQGPEVIVPGDTFSYVFTVTNTIGQPLDLSLVNSLPFRIELIDCTDCTQNVDDNTIIWNGNSLGPDETLNLSLTLKATDTLTSGLILENTVTLIDKADLGPLNGDTLTSVVAADSGDSGLQVSVAGEDGYFFVYNDQAVAKSDGIIQEIVSPWSQKRAILIITGLSDEAVKKAAQAMSSEARFPGMSGPVALVRDVLLPSEIHLDNSPTVEFTFADLGYQEEIIRGEAAQEVGYVFEVPSGWQLTEDAALDLYFSHSQLIDYANSGLTVFLNNIPAATIALSDETSGDGHIRINLANANVQTGENNRLTIQADLGVPGAEGKCVDRADENAWFLIKSSSKTFLAHNEVPINFNLDLDNLPRPFQINPTLTDLLFVLPDVPSVDEWEIALRVAASIGGETTGKTMIPVAVTSGDLSDQDMEMYHFIAIGRPSRNPLIQQINDQLPQPFLLGTDEIEQRLDDVILRLPPDVALGYVQLISSPWHEKRALLAVTGTTTEAAQWATQALVDRSSRLEGNLALIQDDQIATLDTRQLTSPGMAAAVATSVPELTPIVTATAIAIPSPVSDPTPDISTQQQISEEASRPAWLIPLAGVNGLIVIAILVFAFWQARQKRS